MAKKLTKFLTLGMAIIMALGLVGCGNKIPYNATMYGNIYENRTWLNDEFYEDNLTYGSFSNALGDYVEDETYPPYRIKIIVDKNEFDKVFKEFPVEVDFGKSMIIMHCFTTAAGSPYEIKSIVLDEQALIINYKNSTSKKPTAPNASKPLSKWVLVKLDKLDINTAEFIFDK